MLVILEMLLYSNISVAVLYVSCPAAYSARLFSDVAGLIAFAVLHIFSRLTQPLFILADVWHK